MPFFDNPQIELGGIEVLDDSHNSNGSAVFVYYFWKDQERILVFTDKISGEHNNQDKSGLASYLSSRNANGFVPDTREIEVSRNNEKTTREYAVVEDGIEGPLGHVAAIFVYDGYGIELGQSADTWSEEYLSDIQFKLISLDGKEIANQKQ